MFSDPQPKHAFLSFLPTSPAQSLLNTPSVEYHETEKVNALSLDNSTFNLWRNSITRNIAWVEENVG
jgi:hypothetical protein